MIAGFVLWFNLSLGLQIGSYVMPQSVYNFPLYSAEIELHAESEHIDIYTRYRNEMDKSWLVFFAPATDFFTVGLTVKEEHMSVTVEHQCIHPVLSRGFEPDRLSGGYTKIRISVNSSKRE